MITPVACPVPGAEPGGPALNGGIAVTVTPGSRLRSIMQRACVSEAYTCSFELNPEWQVMLTSHGLQVAATDTAGLVRAVELPDHPFFIATLYQPQRSSRPADPHPLIVAFVQAAARARAGRLD